MRVVDQETGEIYGETGLVKPGEYVQSVTFDKVPVQGTAITMRVMSYQPDTYYSAGEVKMNTVVAQGPADYTWLVWVGAIGGVFVLIIGGYAVYLAIDKKRKNAQKNEKKHAKHNK